MQKILKHFRTYKTVIIALIVILFLARYIYLYYLFNFKYQTLKNSKKIDVVVIRNEVITETKISYLVKYNNDKFLLNIYKSDKEYFGKTQGDFLSYAKYSYGDVLRLRGKITIPEKLGNPYEFDYKKYLNSKNICGLITAYDTEYIKSVTLNPLLKTIYFLKEKISDAISRIMPSKEAELFKSMLYGDDRFLNEDVENNFRNIGISHLIAVSGSNVASILTIVYYMSSHLKLNRKIRTCLIIFIIFSFSLICSLEISVVRSSIMATVYTLGDIFNLRIGKIKSLIIAFILIFSFNPYCIFSVGFILSFLATLSIIIYYPKIYSYIDSKMFRIFGYVYREKNENRKLVKIFFRNIIQNAVKLFALTISVMILIFPIQIYFFNSFPLASFIANIVVVGIYSLQRILGFISFFLIFVPYVSDILVNANYILLKIIIITASAIENINMPILRFVTPELFQIIIYYLILFFLYLKSHFKKKLNRYSIKTKIIFFKIGKGKILRLLDFAIFLFIFSIISSYIYFLYFDNYIYFFNVKQGNMAFVRYMGINILIDAGSTTENLSGSVILNFLKAKNINKIDLAIFTHMHSDHINGFEKIANGVKIGRVAFSIPNIGGITEFDDFQRIANERIIPSLNLEEKDEIKLNEITIKVLTPPKETIINSSDLLNSNSNSFVFSIGKINFAFFGDATIETEKYIVDKYLNAKDNIEYGEIQKMLNNLEFFQVAHHGSKTSTSEYFIQNIKAKEAVISARKEEFGHPNEDTLNVLKKYNIKVRIIENEGAKRYKL